MQKTNPLPLLPYSEINLLDEQISYLSRSNEDIKHSPTPDNEQYRRNAETIVFLQQAGARLTAERTAARRAEQKRRSRQDFVLNVVLVLMSFSLVAVAYVIFKTLL